MILKSFGFRRGSIIVREKIAGRDKLTVQSFSGDERESTFNPQSNGWQFLYLDPKTLAITNNDQLTCVSCTSCKKRLILCLIPTGHSD